MTLQAHHGAFVEDAFNYAKHMLAGALSAVVSRTCCAPMETVKMQMIFNHRSGTTMQVAAGVLKDEGIGGFWKGNSRAQLPPSRPGNTLLSSTVDIRQHCQADILLKLIFCRRYQHFAHCAIQGKTSYCQLSPKSTLLLA